MMAERARLLTEHLAALARAGAPLPANLDIAAALDWPYEWVSPAISDAERLGMIRRRSSPHAHARAIAAADGSWWLGKALPGLPPRRCLKCREVFAPPARHRFCCDRCARANALAGE
jgi:hypothetical protein